MRKAFCEALDILEKRGRPIKEILADELERDPARILTAVAKYMPTKTATMTADGHGGVQVVFEIPVDDTVAIEADRVE